MPRPAIPIRSQDTLSETEMADKAWLYGFIAGDGSIQQDDRHAGLLVLCPGQDEKLAKECVRVVDLLFSLGESSICHITVKHNKQGKFEQFLVYVSRQEVVDEILRSYPGLKHGGTIRTTWSVPEWVVAEDSYRKAFVAGFTDSDGHVGHSKAKRIRRVSVDSSNPNLSQIREIIQNYGITIGWSESTNAWGTRCYKAEITFSEDLKRFYEVFPLRSGKKEQLEQIIASYVRYCRRPDVPEEIQKRIRELLLGGKTRAKIAEALNAEVGGRWSYNMVIHVIRKYRLTERAP